MREVRFGRALEPENGLLRVADYEYVRRGMEIHEEREHRVLRAVRVLMLVHEHVLVLFLEHEEEIRVLFRGARHFRDHVVEVVQPLRGECLLIRAEHFRKRLVLREHPLFARVLPLHFPLVRALIVAQVGDVLEILPCPHDDFRERADRNPFALQGAYGALRISHVIQGVSGGAELIDPRYFGKHALQDLNLLYFSDVLAPHDAREEFGEPADDVVAKAVERMDGNPVRGASDNLEKATSH